MLRPQRLQELAVQHLTLIIDNAEQRIWLKVSRWDGSTTAGERVAEALVRARMRGLSDVRVVLRSEIPPAPITQMLRHRGVSVLENQHVHAQELLTESCYVQFCVSLADQSDPVTLQAGTTPTGELAEVAEHARRLRPEFERLPTAPAEAWPTTEQVLPEVLIPFLPPLRLNPLQAQALPEVLDGGRHLIVSAPPGAGKTLIGQVALLRAVKLEAQKAVWLVPSRALASELNDVLREWQQHGLDLVKLAGEEDAESERLARADIWVTTIEKFEALCRRPRLSQRVRDIGCVVLDEVHCLGDAERGHWLEALLTRVRQSAAGTRVVALSATMANAEQLAAWLGAKLIQSDWTPIPRTVQVLPFLECGDRALDDARKNALVASIVADVTEERAGGCPGSVLVFCGSRAACRKVAAHIARARRLDDDVQLLEDCLSRGVGYFYRGSPHGEEVLEQFGNRRLHVLVATTALATGVNTPAHAVVVRDLQLGTADVEPDQVEQMFGRAGRSGRESSGWAFLLCPSTQVADWRQRLLDGYTVRSCIGTRLLDALLAEVVLGRVTSVGEARRWFESTFAWWTGAAPSMTVEIEESLALLADQGFVRRVDARGFAATELGVVTSQLLIEVESAVGLLGVLQEAALERGDSRAAQFVLHALGTHVPMFANPSLNIAAYGELVAEFVRSPSTAVLGGNRTVSGPALTVTAARLALEQPNRLRTTRGEPDMAPLRELVEKLPRYLAWLCALNRLGLHDWPEAAVDDLRCRLAWWWLQPPPQLGEGLLLASLERACPREERRKRVPMSWPTAREESGHRRLDLG